MPHEILSETFKIKFSDTSLGFSNDQQTFLRYYDWVMNPKTWDANGSIKKTLTEENNSGKCIYTPFMDWHYHEEKMWNIILRELILDTEAVVKSRINFTAMQLSEEIFNNIKACLNEKYHDTAGLVFNTLPSKIHNRCRLSAQKDLWKKVNAFYSEVRNNLMHWKQITNGDKIVIQEIFSLYREIYEWLNRVSLNINGLPVVEDTLLTACFPDRWVVVEK